MKSYFEENKITGFASRIPITYFLVLFAFTLILFIEKVAFDSHALIEHDHGDEDGHAHEKRELKTTEASEEKGDSESDSDEEEEVMKNLVSAQGRVGSFIIENNLSKHKGTNVNVDKSLLRASQIRKSGIESQDKLSNIFERVKAKEEELHDHDQEHDHSQEKGGEHEHDHPKPIASQQSSELTPYLLLAALSFHGLFEGIALGLQKNAKSSFSLLVAILAHKWAEALTLGLSFAKTQTEKPTFFKMISLFSIFTPIGIGLGMILTSFPNWVTCSFMSLSVGTFIYIGAAEIIVEEFSITRYKWQKFCFFLIGGLFIAGLTFWEIAGGAEDENEKKRFLISVLISKIIGN